MTETFRVGIVGCGNIAARAHVPIWRELGESALVVAIADPSPTARERVGAQLDLPEPDRHGDPLELIARSDVDIVDVCTPPAFRRAVLIAAARAGKHILCEKPIATVPADAAAAIRAASKANIRFGAMHNYLATPEIVAVGSVLASGEIGEVRSVTVNFLGVVHEPGAAGDWRHDPAQAGGGVLVDMLHGIYVAEALLGSPIERVSAHIAAHLAMHVEDEALCRFDTSSGVGLVNIAWGHGPGGISVSGTNGRVEVRYENGGTAPWAALEHVMVTGADGDARIVLGPATEHRVGDGEFPSMLHGSRVIIERFVDAVRDGSEPMATGADSLRMLESAVGAYASAATGAPVSLPLDRESAPFLRGAPGVRELPQHPRSPFRSSNLFLLKGGNT